MAVCSCNVGTIGTGLSGCNGIAGRSVRRVYTNMVADDGTLNKIAAADITSGIDDTYVQGKIDESDDSKAWFVLPIGKAFTSERADDITEDIDGIPYPTSQGNLPQSFEVIDAPNSLKKAIDSVACRKVGYYDFTADGEIVGHKKDDSGDLYPIPVEKGTLRSKLTLPTKQSFQRLMVNHIVQDNFNDAERGYIPSDSITADLDNVNGALQLIVSNEAASSATDYVLDLSYMLNDSVVSKAYEGFGSATTDIVAYNSTTSSSIVVTSITESVSTPGTYTVVLPAQTTSDVIQFSNGLSGVKFDAFTLTAL